MQSTITRDECRLVQASFAELDPIADEVAATFYRRLFELNPSLAPLFKSDMELQGMKFMEKLAVAVMGLEDLDSIASLVETLGRAHAGYGVQASHYATARDALLWALEDRLGAAFNAQLRSAWAAAYDTISTAMIRASEG
jgi:hemoglobin-like flavoprotein